MGQGMRAFVLMLGLGWALSGWAKEEAPPQVPSALVGTHGFVFVHAPKGGLLRMTVKPVAGGAGTVIDKPVGTRERLGEEAFGYWLPAGRYQIGGWGSYAQEAGPVFDVEAGRVTDLGGFVPISLGGYQLALMPVRHAEDAATLASAIAPFKDLVVSTEPLLPQAMAMPTPVTLSQPSSGLGLIADLLLAYDRKVNKPSTLQRLKDARDPAEFLRLARMVVPPLQDEPALAPDGTAWFPADFGQLRRRSPSGEWDNVGIDTLRQILAVEYDNGRLVAGSDDGQLRASDDGGRTWRTLASLGAGESVIDIDQVGDRWVVVTTRQFDDPKAPRGGGLVVAMPGTRSVAMRVYTGRDAGFSDLQVSKAFTLAPKDVIGWLGARGQAFDGRYYLAAGTALHRLDIAAGTWTPITPGPRISSHRLDPRTGTLVALWSQGAFSKVHVSTDGGTQWTQIGRPPYVINDVQMDAPDRGWASRWNANAFSGVWETYRYVPARKDWEKSGEAPAGCRPIRYTADAPVLCITTGASIFGLHDGKWEVEFSAN